MSIHALKWAWGQPCPNPTAKLVLMALADHANADGECYPTMNRVAQLASCSPRTVSRHIQQLEDAGLVRRVERRTTSGGEFRGFLYRLEMAATSGQSDQWTSRPVDTGVGSGTPSSSNPLPPLTNGQSVAWREEAAERRRRERIVGTPEYEARIERERIERERLAGG